MPAPDAATIAEAVRQARDEVSRPVTEAAPEPSAPEPAAPEPSAPEPSAPEPSAPEPSAPEPTPAPPAAAAPAPAASESPPPGASAPPAAMAEAPTLPAPAPLVPFDPAGPLAPALSSGAPLSAPALPLSALRVTEPADPKPPPSEPSGSPRGAVEPEPAGPSAVATRAPALEPPSEPPPRSRAAALGSSNRTMLGQPAPRPLAEASSPTSRPPLASSPPRERAPVMYPDPSSAEEPLTLPVRGSGALPKVVLALGLVAFLLGGGVLAWRLLRSGSDLVAAVVQGEDGETLEVEVPGAAEGTRLRFRGTERPLEAGRARFPLRAEDLALGDNRFNVDVVGPEGDVRAATLELHLELRVRADLGPLASTPPAFDVVVEAPRGSTAELDGEALELDASGRGARRYPVEPSQADAEGRVERLVRYRVVPPEGQAAQGELRARFPLAALRIDRPGRALVTDRASLEVAGAVAADASVTVAGRGVEVREGRFVTEHALTGLGEHTLEVVARAPGKAPRVERIEVRRVADLAAEAARYEVERDLSYARIQTNPDTYRGRRVAFEGSVFNVEVREGRSTLQMLVTPCPEGQRCSIWVTYPAATEVERGSRVRVLGTLAGVQQYRTQREERADPRLDAVFVLPAAPEPPPRRR